MYYKGKNDVNCLAVVNLLTRNILNEILHYLHLADNGNLKEGDKLAKATPFYDILNEKFLKYFPYE